MPRGQMPSLGPEPKKNPMPKVLAIAILVGALVGGIYWVRKTPSASSGDASPTAPTTELAQTAEVDAGAAATAAPVAEAPKGPSREEQLAKSGLKTAQATIRGPLETAIVDAVGPQVGPALTQVVTRSLVWWVSVPGDLLRGDTLDIVYEERVNQEPLVHAVRFHSTKHGKTFKAFLYKASSESYPRFYEESGAELEERLTQSPIADYEQITSLLRDGRRHKGVDFKAPEGTPVMATFDGTITRRNWSFRGNGNSIEVTERGGRRKALYLHLEELPSNIRVGMRVARGEVIAKSGNTGRSFAPHLHYQLMGAGGSKVLDPFVEHGTFRKSLPETERAAFEAARQRLEALLPPRAEPAVAQTP